MSVFRRQKYVARDSERDCRRVHYSIKGTAQPKGRVVATNTRRMAALRARRLSNMAIILLCVLIAGCDDCYKANDTVDRIERCMHMAGCATTTTDLRDYDFWQQYIARNCRRD